MPIPFVDLKEQYSRNKNSIDKAIASVLEHGQYIMGPEVSSLELQLAKFAGTKYAITCSSGTDALVLPLMTLNLTKNDAVFTTPFTFFASAEAISLSGGTPVFVDIDPNTYNICPKSLEEKIHNIKQQGILEPRAVLAVDIFGLTADYDAISKIADDHALFLLEDAAQSFGATYKNKKAGSFGNAAATSFYPSKPLGCYGDGGAVFTDDDELYNQIISLRVHGQAANGDKYDNTRIGMNARMDTIQAAVLLEKLKIFDQELVERNRVANLYTENLKNHVVTPVVPEGQTCAWAQYSIQAEDRRKLEMAFKKVGLPWAIFYSIPIHLSAAYEHLEYKEGDFPIAEAVSKRIFSLPMHPYLEPDQIKFITDTIKSVA